MRIFTDRIFKLQFTVIALVFLLLTILGQVVVKHMADEYKQNLISHDYGVAGYLIHNKPEGTKIAEAFTAAKTDIDIETGRELLQASGYTSNIQNSLLPEADYFHRKFAVISLILSIAFFRPFFWRFCILLSCATKRLSAPVWIFKALWAETSASV